MLKGYLAIHLHAHLPYVRHPDYERFLEEKWFFDAIIDTYVPLLLRLEQLHDEGIPHRLSMTLSPTLLLMFADKLLQERFQRHLSLQLELCDKELSRIGEDAGFGPIINLYHRRLISVKNQFSRFHGNLAAGFKRLADLGHLELVTCAATHALLPHLQLVPEAIARQLQYAAETHERLLGRAPDGIWLPECAYTPGLEAALVERGLLYTFADSHALYLGLPRSVRGVYSHVYLPNGLAVFARDIESSKQVWSAKEGYPGDYAYRDYYRDIGFDLPIEYVAPYIHDYREPVLTGFKYYAITGETDDKKPYDPALGLAKAKEHAYHFIWCREQQVRWLQDRLDREPILVAPYDAELFGHWWFEGPDFLYYLFRAAAENPVIHAIAAKDYLLKYPRSQVVIPNTSSWGDGGYYRVWTNQSNEWIYPHTNALGRVLAEAKTNHQPWTSKTKNQAERELLLAQASDWAFILTSGTSPGYAAEQTIQHLNNASYLLEALDSNSPPEKLAEIERRDNAFSFEENQ